MASFDLNFYRLYRPELYPQNCYSTTETVIFKSDVEKATKPLRFPGSSSDHQFNDDVVLSVCNSEAIVIFLMKSGKVFITGRSSYGLGNSNYGQDANNDGTIYEMNVEPLRNMDTSPFKQLCATNSLLYAVMMSGRLFSCTDAWKEIDFEEKNLKFQYVTTGLAHMLAITDKGDVYGHGFENYGCLGGTVGKIDFKHLLDEDDYILDVYAAYYRSLAVTAKGKLLTTGWGVYSQQGLGNNSDNVHRFQLHEPMEKLGEVVIKVALGALHTIILTKSRKVYGFGFNNYGQLSQETTTDHHYPTLIVSPYLFIDIWCGWHHTMLESENGSFYCCGSNSSSELCGAGEQYTNSSILKVTNFAMPTSQSENWRWKINTCSFSSNNIYQGIKLNTKRVDRMFSNLKEMSSSRFEFSDLLFD